MLPRVLIVSIGKFIAKAVLRLWLKDPTGPSQTATDLLDILSSQTEDVIAQHSGKQLLEQIGLRTARSLLPLFSGSRLPSNEQEAVADAVHHALQEADISAELLVQTRLEPVVLFKHLQKSLPRSTRFLSTDAKSFLERILREIATCTIDIAAKLPSFTERTFAEILQRQVEILTIVENTLAEVKRIRIGAAADDPDGEASEFEEEYRRALIRRLDEIRLFGVDVSSASGRHQLSVAYISLAVSRENSRFVRGSTKPGSTLVGAHKALGSVRRAIITGLPGSGKTTLLNWLAVGSASLRLQGKLSHMNAGIPFMIRLREFVGRKLPQPQEFPSLIAPSISATMPDNWVHTQLSQGRGIVLVDGVDEVPDSLRDDVRAWLRDLAGTYPKCRFIVTSRPHAVDDAWLSNEGFSRMELQPMTPSDIRRFIEHWHRAVAAEIRSPKEIERTKSLSERLQNALRMNRALRGLATNPLLCAILCALHRDREDQLPSDRIELYEACVSMLLERRDVERNIVLEEYPKLTYRQKRALLEDLAYWMLENGWAEIETCLLEERFAKSMENMTFVSDDVTPSAIRRLLTERSGLIRETTGGRIDFTHKTFQEYLAAHAARDEGDTGVLVRLAVDAQWRQTVVLASGLGSRSFHDRLLREILSMRRDTHGSTSLDLLAAECIEASVGTSPPIREAVAERLQHLDLPNSVQEEEGWIAAGDLAVPYLGRRAESATASQARACIRVLARIGGEDALAAIEEYADSDSPAIADELLRAVAEFDRDEFSERVFPKCRVQILDLKRMSTISGFRHFPHLHSLFLSSSQELDSIGEISQMDQLCVLSLINLPLISDITTLAQATSLEELELLSSGRIADLSPLSNLVGLQVLSLGSLGLVSDIEALAPLLDLRTLSLSGLRSLRDLSPIGSLTSLQTLLLEDIPSSIEPDSLSALNKLRRLHIRRIDGPLSIAQMAGMTDLHDLDLTDVPKLTEVNDLERIHSLNLLSLRGTNASLLKHVGRLPHLQFLRIDRLRGAIDLREIEDLSTLTELHIYNTPNLKNVDALARLPNLRQVHFRKVLPVPKLPKELRASVTVASRVSSKVNPMNL